MINSYAVVSPCNHKVWAAPVDSELVTVLDPCPQCDRPTTGYFVGWAEETGGGPQPV